MYRSLVALLCLTAALAAPQEANSDITYVKKQPITSVENDSPHLLNRRESKIQNLPLKIAPTNLKLNQSELEFTNDSDSSESESRARIDDGTTANYESAETTELAEASTERHEHVDPVIAKTEEYESQTKRAPPPRFYSKLSYFQKPTIEDRALTTNLIEKKSKRKFRSKCRCERIWNCPKLQLSVPRCPNEYFMCCF